MRRGWAAVQSKPIARSGGVRTPCPRAPALPLRAAPQSPDSAPKPAPQHAAQSRAASVHARRQPRLGLPREALRQAFIDQALSYVGTPYLRMKSHPAEHTAGYKALPRGPPGRGSCPWGAWAPGTCA